MGYDLVIFDCDGTLVDSETLNNQATLDVLESLGITGYTLDHAFNEWMGTTYTSIGLIVQMERKVELPKDFTMRCVARVAELQEQELKSVKGAIEMVRAMNGKKIRMCIASNGERTNVINSVRLTGLSEFFPEERVFTKVQVARPKPAPDIFLFAAEKMDALPAGCVVIEDSEAGVNAGVAAGMKVIGFIGTSHDPVKQAQRLKNAGASEVIDDFIHMPSLLGY
jgi:HAD superfamily hydrolase (TIGR01509 family)